MFFVSEETSPLPWRHRFTFTDLYDECARIVGQDCRDPRSIDDITRSIYSVIKQSSDPASQTYSQIIVTSSKKNHRPSVLECARPPIIDDQLFNGPPPTRRAGVVEGPTSTNSSQETTVSDVLSSLLANKAKLAADQRAGNRRDLFLNSGSFDYKSVDEY
eukprot:sb/3472888/